MIFVATEQFMPEILEEHLETAAFLFEQREQTLSSSANTFRDAREADERIASHLDGLTLAGVEAHALLEQALGSDEPPVVRAAAYALLSMKTPEADALALTALESASTDALQALRLALSDAAPAHLAPALRQIAARSDRDDVACAVTESLLYGGTEVELTRLGAFQSHSDASVRTGAWQITALAAARAVARMRLERTALMAALRDEEPLVRSAALEACIWSRQDWILKYCRDRVKEPEQPWVPEMAILAVLGAPEDLDHIVRLAARPSLGLRRFQLLASFGHPKGVEPLLEALGSTDPAVAAAAATAFTRLTGFDVNTTKRVAVSGPGESPADEFEAEFVEEVLVPDTAAAKAWWGEARARFNQSTRRARGLDLSKETLELANRVDLMTRSESIKRMHYRSARDGSPQELTRFPLR